MVEYQGVLERIVHSQPENSTVSPDGMFSNLNAGSPSEVGSIENLLPLPFVPAGSVKEEQIRKKNFLFHLNKSGAYFFFKEQLKSAVVEVVREVSCFLFAFDLDRNIGKRVHLRPKVIYSYF